MRRRIAIIISAIFPFLPPANASYETIEHRTAPDQLHEDDLVDVHVSNLDQMVEYLILLKIPFQKLNSTQTGGGFVRVLQKDQIVLAAQDIIE